MLYQLPNGKCVEMSTEQYFRMSDEELELYLAYNVGEEVNDPFALSVLRHGSSAEKFEMEIDPIDESLIEDEDYIEDLTEILPEDKLYDEDYIDPDNLEM